MPWLIKTEPGTYSFDDLRKEKTTVWDGISNAAALKHLREMARGDDVLVYHSGKDRAAVGRASVAKAAYADPKLSDEKRVVVEIKAGEPLKHPVSLDVIKADKAFAGWDLIRIGRLSVVPTSQAIFDRVLQLSEASS